MKKALLLTACLMSTALHSTTEIKPAWGGTETGSTQIWTEITISKNKSFILTLPEQPTSLEWQQGDPKDIVCSSIKYKPASPARNHSTSELPDTDKKSPKKPDRHNSEPIFTITSAQCVPRCLFEKQHLKKGQYEVRFNGNYKLTLGEIPNTTYKTAFITVTVE